MAQSFVRVPVDGLGKLIDTWTTAIALQQRQCIVIGDPSVDANVISISSRLRLPIELENIFDYDTGAGSDDTSAVGLVLPASGGAAVAGIVSNPLFTRLSDGSSAVDVANAANQTTEIARLTSILASLDVALSTRATEVTVASILTKLLASIAVTGSVTANAGTNLNTSALALEAGNLATLAGIISAARAAVNLIAGQVGITAGAGAVATNTPRTTLASDDPSVAVLGAITGTAIITDIDGTIQRYLRGLIKLIITAGSFLITVSNSKRSQKAAASAAFTITLASLASSATLVAGREGTAIATSTFEPVLDFLVGGKITAGTTPTVSTFINVYVYASVNDTPLYPDVFDGTDSDETITSENVRNSAIRLLASIVVDNTSDRTYWIAPVSIKSLFNGILPTHWGLFVTQNTAANLNATGSNQALYYTPVYRQQIA